MATKEEISMVGFEIVAYAGDAQTDLLGIGTADTGGSVGTTGLLCGLAHQFTESHGTGFVSCCVDVGNIITDYVHSGLVCLKSCYARIQ